MKKYARIDNENVVEFFETDDDITKFFHPSLIWVECDNVVELGWKYINNQFSISPENTFTIQELKNKKWEEIKKSRDLHEFGSFFWNELEFDADSVSQLRLSFAVIKAQSTINNSEDWSIDWRLKNNEIVTLSALQILEIGLALGNNTLLAHEHANQLRELIYSQTTDTESELDNIVW